MHMSLRRHPPLLAALCVLCVTSAAHATGITEFPDNGSEQGGRGGAWIARASDPIAAFYNPAGLAGQPTRLIMQANVNFQSTCFNRLKALNDPTSETGQPIKPGQYFGNVCNDVAAAVDPQLALTIHVTDRIGVGLAPILAPSGGASTVNFPTFVPYSVAGQTSYGYGPTRYMLTAANLLVVTPTIGIGAEVVKGLRLGASFQWGVASLSFANAVALGANTGAPNNQEDVAAHATAHDYFFPGITAGVLYSPLDSFDVAGWFKWSGPINATGDVVTGFPYGGSAPKATAPAIGNTSLANCGIAGGPTTCGSGNNLSMSIPIPMEVKVGFRYHKLRSDVPYDEHVRDPMAQDVFDVEADLTWANDSAFQNLQARLPGNAVTGQGIIPINGLQNVGGAVAPVNNDSPHFFSNVLGVRLGGDYNVVRDTLALRAGGFIQSSAQNPQYQNIDFPGSTNGGVTFGTTWRVHLSKEKSRALEISMGYEHVFYAAEINNGPNGLSGVAGTNCLGTFTQAPNSPNCVDKATGQTIQAYRTLWPVNLGIITNSINVLNVGVGYKF